MKAFNRKPLEREATSDELETYHEEDGQESNRLRLEFIVSAFKKRLKDAFREKLIEVIREYRYGDGRQISEDIFNFLEEHEMLEPRVDILYGKEADPAIREFELDCPLITEEEALVIFNLPKNLDHFWWKNSQQVAPYPPQKEMDKPQPGTEAYYSQLMGWSNDDQRPNKENLKMRKVTKGKNIEWGLLYERVMPSVHLTIRQFMEDRKIDLQRLNAIGKHSQGNYYYVWRVKLINNQKDN